MVADITVLPSVAEEAEREWPVTIRLRQPIEFGSERIEEITMRRGQARDMKGIKFGTEIPMESLILIAARLSGRPSAVIERLDQDDCGEVFAIALGFWVKCLSTTRTLSPF